MRTAKFYLDSTINFQCLCDISTSVVWDCIMCWYIKSTCHSLHTAPSAWPVNERFPQSEGRDSQRRTRTTMDRCARAGISPLAHWPNYSAFRHASIFNILVLHLCPFNTAYGFMFDQVTFYGTILGWWKENWEQSSHANDINGCPWCGRANINHMFCYKLIKRFSIAFDNLICSHMALKDFSDMSECRRSYSSWDSCSALEISNRFIDPPHVLGG